MKFFGDEVTGYGILATVLIVLQIMYYISQLNFSIRISLFKKTLSWKQYNKLIRKLAKKIKGSGIDYKMIVAFGRGGAFCAASLSCNLGSIPVLILDREYITEDGLKTAKFYEEQIKMDPKYESMKKDHILVLSQQSDPGITLNALESIMKRSGFVNIDRCAVLKSNKTTDADLRYCAYEYSPDKKCKKFPWEKNKGYKDIMAG